MTRIKTWFRLHWPVLVPGVIAGAMPGVAYRLYDHWTAGLFVVGAYMFGWLVGEMVVPWYETRKKRLLLPDIPDDYPDFVEMETEAYDLTGGSPVNKVEVQCNEEGLVQTMIYFEFAGHEQRIRWLWHRVMGQPIKTAFTSFAKSAAKSEDWPFISERKAQ